ncbi:aspartate kinase [Marnyiella aurantia]|uniref:Aspartokinase n=1 Tax=Marnyiella aurantia TaxID=2758037 RepID=A0A7D7QL48_9FLAO|nr:aspartate kinase [Marnyiella aurantia]MBA5245772.1 aspartate kinase [Marnyiella aurantia]QMS98825.1 aspartate kinase [Marnyiella aurantia]
MKVFKFGGASVKDANGVRNVATVLNSQGTDACLLVVSAMGKTTNALENAISLYFNKGDYHTAANAVAKNHLDTARELFEGDAAILQELQAILIDLLDFLKKNKSPDYSYVYDQVVSTGELLSSKIVSEYLNSCGYSNKWLDAREFIKTDGLYREGTVNWETTVDNIRRLDKDENYVTQGFIGSDNNNFTTTLGREGSDYSAAIFAYGLDADALTIWKDVPGVMTGDPRKFSEVQLLDTISYEEAIEMAYFGASVIHPKTLQPLQKKNIPFYVKSFLEPEQPGTKVSSTAGSSKLPSFILKENQHLAHISTRDFSFIAEEHISQIFNVLAKHKIKVSLMQNTAISLALCLEDKYGNLEEFNKELSAEFKIDLRGGVSLFTVRNVEQNEINRYCADRQILLEQISRNTVQMVIE